MPLQATSGAASYDAFGGGVAAVPNYIEDVFSTYLYTGTGTADNKITNNIDLSTKGGMVWLKSRSGAYNNYLTTNATTTSSGGGTTWLYSNTTDALLGATGTGVCNFFTDGFDINPTGVGINGSGQNYSSWTFRKQPKFFDIVTYTGNGTSGRAISHSLGSTPGCIIIKRTNTTGNWATWHRSLTSLNYGLYLNTTDAEMFQGWFSNVDSTSFTISGSSDVNANGSTYVAYIYAHNAGGFGLTGTDNVISCGSYTGNGSTTGPIITLGYEPQWLMIKRTSSTGSWYIFDSMRGLRNSGGVWLLADTSDAENTSVNIISSLATGFQPVQTGTATNGSGDTYIYIAIRRGPMKVPTSGTSVFYPQAISQADNIDSTGVPFPPDLVNTFSRNGTGRASTDLFQFVDRLRGLGTPNNTFTASAPRLVSSDTSAENTGSSYVQLKADSQNITRGTGWNSASYGNWIDYFWRRAPSFFDEVCYIGNSTSGQTYNHNLSVAPELIIVKQRNESRNWIVGNTSVGWTKFLQLNSTTTPTTLTGIWSDTNPTSSVFTVGSSVATNGSGSTYVAYLFATCPGVSKVGSYAGTGALQTVNCGFAAGARFVLVKRTDSTGDWFVWDSARGITSGNDPYLLLNSTDAEVTGTNYVDTDTTGFKVTAAAPAGLNASGGTYIFLAIA